MSAVPVLIVPILGRIGLRLSRGGLRCIGLRRRGLRLGARAALDDLVKLAAIQPNAPAFRTIVDLDALAFAHDEIDSAGRTKEPMTFPLRTCISEVHHLRLLVLDAPRTRIVREPALYIGSLPTRDSRVRVELSCLAAPRTLVPCALVRRCALSSVPAKGDSTWRGASNGRSRKSARVVGAGAEHRKLGPLRIRLRPRLWPRLQHSGGRPTKPSG